MNRYTKLSMLSILITLLLLFLAPPVLAASSSFFNKAQEYYQKDCTRRPERVRGDDAVLCYAFDKLGELQTSFNALTGRTEILEEKVEDLENENISLSEKVSSLENRILILENPSTTTTKLVTFATDRPQPFDSDWIDTTDYSKIKINLSITGSITQYDIHYSNDPSTYTVQQTVNCNNSSTCPEAIVSVLGKYYRISTGTASGNITSTGLLFN